ncbi:ABC transporter permease [Afipia felis]
MTSTVHHGDKSWALRSSNSSFSSGSWLARMAISFATNRLLAVVPLIVIWEVTTRLWGSSLLPPFSTVMSTFLTGLFLPGHAASAYGGPEGIPLLIYQSGSSLVRVGAGFACAALVGVPLGFAMGYFRKIDSNLDPIISTLRPVPPIAWIPLAILWFGLGMKPTIFIIFIGTLFPIILNTFHGVKGTPIRLIEFARVLGATRKQVLFKVIVFEAFPSIITGMRVGFGIGWMSVVAAEMIAAKSGLGYLIMTARWFFATDMVLAGMLMIGLIGFGGDLLLRYVERKFSKWRVALVA